MATNKYYSESELVQKKQDGEFGWLDYVPEEEYTEELWNEQKKAGLRSMGHMR